MELGRLLVTGGFAAGLDALVRLQGGRIKELNGLPLLSHVFLVAYLGLKRGELT